MRMDDNTDEHISVRVCDKSCRTCNVQLRSYCKHVVVGIYLLANLDYCRERENKINSWECVKLIEFHLLLLSLHWRGGHLT